MPFLKGFLSAFTDFWTFITDENLHAAGFALGYIVMAVLLIAFFISLLILLDNKIKR